MRWVYTTFNYLDIKTIYLFYFYSVIIISPFVFQINSQLLEAIQQKVELSQQLDQWQADMEELLEEQMLKKMRAMEAKAAKGSGNDSDSSTQAVESKKSKILSFFGR